MEAALAAADALRDSAYESPTERQSFPPIWQRTLLGGEPQRGSGLSDRSHGADSADRRTEKSSERTDKPSERTDKSSERSVSERSVRSVSLSRADLQPFKPQPTTNSAQPTKIIAALAASLFTVLTLLTLRPNFCIDTSRRIRWEVVFSLGVVCGIATFFISEGMGA